MLTHNSLHLRRYQKKKVRLYYRRAFVRPHLRARSYSYIRCKYNHERRDDAIPRRRVRNSDTVGVTAAYIYTRLLFFGVPIPGVSVTGIQGVRVPCQLTRIQPTSPHLSAGVPPIPPCSRRAYAYARHYRENEEGCID